MKSSLLDKILKILFPPRCIFCGEILEPKARIEICNGCYRQIPFIPNQLSINKRKTDSKYLDTIVCLCKYSGILKSSIIKYKFFEKPGYYRTFSQLLLRKIEGLENIREVDIALSVPLHKEKFKERGYNQSLLISTYLAKGLKIEEGSRFLLRSKNTPSQSLIKERNKRYFNIKNAFRVNNSQYFADKTIILVDDIVTTGFTLDECARVLKEAGAKKIIGAVIASNNENITGKGVF